MPSSSSSSLLSSSSSGWKAIAVGLCLAWCRGAKGLSTTPPPSNPAPKPKPTLEISKIRAISFDVTGTLLATKEPVVKSYHDAAIWARLPDPPIEEDLKKAFKIAFRERSIESPCFGGVEGISGRDWWQSTIRRVLHHAKGTTNSDIKGYTEEDFQRYFRRVYQHFGSPAGYMVLDDAQSLLESLSAMQESDDLVLGITSNTPTRHMESVLPMLDCLHDKFSWFTCSQEVGHEKPSREIFEDAFQKASFWLDDPHLEKDAILHIGDSHTCDYCGARAYGFQALLLDRSDHPSVTAYQDWLEAPEYPGKSLEDVENNTITSLEEVADLLLLGKH